MAVIRVLYLHPPSSPATRIATALNAAARMAVHTATTADDARDAVFDRGYSTNDGTGLGLTIVQAIAEAHGWSAAVVDGADGGARFEFSGVDCPVPAR